MVTVDTESMPMLGQPSGGAGDTFFDGDGRLPPQSRSRLRRIRKQHHHFARPGTQASIILNDARGTLEYRARDVKEFGDRNRPAGAEVNLLAFDALGAGRFDKPLDGVRDI